MRLFFSPWAFNWLFAWISYVHLNFTPSLLASCCFSNEPHPRPRNMGWSAHSGQPSCVWLLVCGSRMPLCEQVVWLQVSVCVRLYVLGSHRAHSLYDLQSWITRWIALWETCSIWAYYQLVLVSSCFPATVPHLLHVSVNESSVATGQVARTFALLFFYILFL